MKQWRTYNIYFQFVYTLLSYRWMSIFRFHLSLPWQVLTYVYSLLYKCCIRSALTECINGIVPDNCSNDCWRLSLTDFVWGHRILFLTLKENKNTGSSRLMRISLLRILLLRFFKTITIILLMRFYGLFILLVRSLAKNLANAIFG